MNRDDRLLLEPDGYARSLTVVFAASFGYTADGIWYLPGSVALFGDGDGDAAIRVVVPWGALVGAARTEDGALAVRSLDAPGEHYAAPLAGVDPAAAPPWARTAAGVAGALVGGRNGSTGPPKGLSLLTTELLPSSWGVGNSVALGCAVAVAVRELYGPGTQDAPVGSRGARLAVLTCPDCSALVLEPGGAASETVPFDLEAAGLRLLLVQFGDEDAPGGVAPSAGADQALGWVRTGDWDAVGAALSRRPVESPAAARVRDAVLAAGALGIAPSRVEAGRSTTMLGIAPEGAIARIRVAAAGAGPFARRAKVLTTVAKRGL